MSRSSYFDAGRRTGPTDSQLTVTERGTRAAWERFVTDDRGGEVQASAVRADILASWRRSAAQGVDVGIRRSRKIADENEVLLRQERNLPLREAARAAFRRLEPHLSDARTILILADAQGIIIDAIGDASVLDEGQDIHLEVGGDWSETIVGTNGIGTALLTGKPTYVHAAEHFVEGVQGWTCAGVPIQDPISQAVIGVVDLSGPPDIFRQHNIALVLSAAREIEIALAERQRQERTQLLEAFLMSDYSHLDASVLLLDRDGRILFRRGVDDKTLPPSTQLSVGHKLLPKLDEVSDRDLQRYLPQHVEARGLERLVFENTWRGAALFIDSGRPSVRPAGEACRIRPRRDVGEEDLRIIGASPRMLEAIELAERAARANVSILVQGETGVGKELFARLIHARLKREDAPYVPLNCGAIGADLIGAELFGYVDGAFTGAVKGGRAGKFEQADGGLLCLDEIGDMPLDMQPYLLRALEQRAVYRIGDSRRRAVDVRLVAMTNRDLRQEVDRGRFRRDLFYRISAVTIDVPPLRERGSDIAALAAHFSERLAQETGRPALRFTDGALQRLNAHRWPGNVRELRNLMQRLYVLAPGPVVAERDLPADVLSPAPPPLAADPAGADLESIEASAIRRTLAAEGGNLTRVAAVLGISRPTLYRKIRQYDIDRAVR